MEPLCITNIGRFTEIMHKFATWLNERMLSGKRGLIKQAFSSCLQFSRSLSQHLSETNRLDYLLTGNIQLDPLEKRFGRYRQLSGANYFGSKKQFLDAEKSINFLGTQ